MLRFSRFSWLLGRLVLIVSTWYIGEVYRCEFMKENGNYNYVWFEAKTGPVERAGFKNWTRLIQICENNGQPIEPRK